MLCLPCFALLAAAAERASARVRGRPPLLLRRRAPAPPPGRAFGRQSQRLLEGVVVLDLLHRWPALLGRSAPAGDPVDPAAHPDELAGLHFSRLSTRTLNY